MFLKLSNAHFIGLERIESVRFDPGEVQVYFMEGHLAFQEDSPEYQTLHEFFSHIGETQQAQPLEEIEGVIKAVLNQRIRGTLVYSKGGLSREDVTILINNLTIELVGKLFHPTTRGGDAT